MSRLSFLKLSWALRSVLLCALAFLVLSVGAVAAVPNCCAAGMAKAKREALFGSTEAPRGMIWVEGGEFEMGAVDGDDLARPDETPRHRVRVNGFFMDTTEVTNAQFAEFVEATGYVTTAEKKIDADELMKGCAPGTPRPSEDSLQPGAVVFTPGKSRGDVRNNDWWSWVHGADWRHPRGPDSSIRGLEDHPVVHVSFEDAQAYAKWAGKRLPTEAEWEYAARGGRQGEIHPWGNEPPDVGKPKANTWMGKFPVDNNKLDGYELAAPVKSYPPNALGLHDMSGNVWEWVTDLYRPDTYAQRVGEAVVENPQGPSDSFDPDEPYAVKNVIRGGSYLCHDSYCASYRTSARMKTTPDTGSCHVGFRCVKNR